MKILLSFSDVTTIHDVNKHIGWRSVHDIVAANNNYQRYGEKGINNKYGITPNLRRNPYGINYPSPAAEYAGTMAGVSRVLMGGNLTLLQSLSSTHYENTCAMKYSCWRMPASLINNLTGHYQLQYEKDVTPNAIIFSQFYPLSANDEERLIFKSVIRNFADATPIPVYYYPYFGRGEEQSNVISIRRLLLVLPNRNIALSGSRLCGLSRKEGSREIRVR